MKKCGNESTYKSTFGLVVQFRHILFKCTISSRKSNFLQVSDFVGLLRDQITQYNTLGSSSFRVGGHHGVKFYLK